MQKLFGKNYEEIGSLDKNLVLQTAGRIKIHYGRRYFDLLNSKGELNVDLQDIIQSKKSLDDIDENGFYFVDGDLVAYVNGQIIQLASGGEGSTYVSFIEDQDEKGDAKEKAMTNIGFLYKTLQDVKNPPTNGIIYVESEKAFYIVQNGEISKYTIDFPNPYPERFVIQKIDQSSNGAIYIMGEGIQNSLYFDGLAIFQEGGKAFYESDLGHNFYVGGQNVFNITLKGAETNGIQSPGATSNVGYRIYQEGGRYILDIDSIHVRDGIQAEESLVPVWYYNEENLIKEYSLNGRQGYLVLKYLNTYKVGDKIQIYTDFTPEGQSYKQMVLVKGTVTTVEGNQIGVTFDSDVLSDLTNKKINLVERDSKPNDSLIIGEIGSVYNGEHEGIVSKQNIFHSAKYETDSSSDPLTKEIYPFYSDELYNKFDYLDSLSEIPPGMEKIIPPYGKIKLNNPLRDINNSNLGMPSSSYSPTTLQNVLDELLRSLYDPDYEPSYDNVPLNESPQVIAYDNGWKYSGIPSTQQFGAFLGRYTDGLTDVINTQFQNTINYINEYAQRIIDDQGDYSQEVQENFDCVKSVLSTAVQDAVPIGTIIMWGRGVDTIPEGWHICDGTNGTPNLQDKFVIGAGSNHPAGSTGGSEDGKISFTITQDQMPKHRHKVVGEFGDLGDNANMRFMPTNENGTISKNAGGVDDGWTVNAYVQTAETGKGDPVEIEYTPPYYALIYIMKISNIEIDFESCGDDPDIPIPPKPDDPIIPDPDIKQTLTREQFRYSVDYIEITEEGQSLPYLINTEEVSPIQYSTTDSSVATVLNNGRVIIHKNGNVSITATFEGDDEYNPAEVGYYLKVNIQEIQPKTELEELIEAFENTFGQSLQEGPVNEYLTTAYNTAKQEFESNSGSWDPEIYEDNGILFLNTSGGDSTLAFKAYVSWLFAQILTELNHDKRNDLFELAYQLGGGDYSIYNTTLKNNPNVDRIASSILYAKQHDSWNSYIAASLNQLGLSKDYSTNVRESFKDEGSAANYLDFLVDCKNCNPSNNYILSVNGPKDSQIDETSKQQYGRLIDPNSGLIDMYNQSTDNQRAKQAITDENVGENWLANLFAQAIGLSSAPNSWIEFISFYMYVSVASYFSTKNSNPRCRPPRINHCSDEYDGEDDGYPLNDLRGRSWANDDGEERTPKMSKRRMRRDSYPSGHSTTAWGVAMMLIQRYPEKYKEIAHRAWIFANNRVVARFHFYSDTIHGRMTGGTVLSAINHYNSFTEELNSL